MSRIIVKNLPKKVTEELLREKFGEKGTVTDVQLKYTKDGQFRHFAFVGYSTEAEAKAAIEYFNQSYFNSLRITVESCSDLGDKNKPRSWSKYASDSSAFKKLHESNKKKAVEEKKQKETSNPIVKELSEKLEKFRNDPEFLEFMEVHNKDKSVWSNDDIKSFLVSKREEAKSNEDDSGVEEDTEHDSERKIADDETVSDANYLKLKTGQKTLEEVREEKNTASDQYFTLVIRGLPYKTKKRQIKEFFRPLKLDSIRIPVKIKGLAYVAFKDENNMKKALLRDKSFIDGKRIFICPLKTKQEMNAFENHFSTNEKWKEQEESLNLEESVAESGRIFVRNLPYTTTEEELQPLFEKYGPVTEIIVPLDKLTRKIKGYAVITYLMPEHAVKAFTELDGIVFHGRMLHLLPGKAKQDDEFLADVKEGSSFKTKKMQSLKAAAASSHNWNTLFLGSNAVANVMAENYNVSKEQILCNDNAAVRLALGETQVVHEMREFLESSGVKLDAFNRAVNHRSKSVILVKNLPANTKANELRELFAKYGVLGRVLLPPHGITGIVEFVEPAEARTAFKRLAYSKFKNLPLYLEWAPDDTFASKTENEKSDDSAVGVENDAVKEDEDEQPEPDTTIFIKNINFQTTEDAIREHFKRIGKIASVSIAKKKDPKRPGEMLSMGYGFIQFYKKRCADAALKELQQSTLDDYCLELKRSNRTLKAEAHLDRKSTNVEKQTSSKILVRNVPFQAKLQELQELFKTFGEIKALRLPKKMTGSGPHRGFAFVEYHSKEEARRAMQSLSQSTHLYGRRLVLEWAQTAEEDLDQIRKRAAERFPTSTEVRSKKSKADMVVEDDSDKDEEDEINMME